MPGAGRGGHRSGQAIPGQEPQDCERQRFLGLNGNAELAGRADSHPGKLSSQPAQHRRVPAAATRNDHLGQLMLKRRIRQQVDEKSCDGRYHVRIRKGLPASCAGIAGGGGVQHPAQVVRVEVFPASAPRPPEPVVRVALQPVQKPFTHTPSRGDRTVRVVAERSGACPFGSGIHDRPGRAHVVGDHHLRRRRPPSSWLCRQG